MLDPVVKNPWVRALGALLVLSGIGVIAHALRGILIPLLCAFLVAYMFDPVIDRLERRRIPRMSAVVALVLALMIGALVLPLMVLPGLVTESQKLVASAQTSLHNQSLDGMLNRLPLRQAVDLLGWTPEGKPDYDPRAVMAEKIGKIISDNVGTALDYVRNHIGDIFAAGHKTGAFVVSIGSAILGVFLFLGNFVLFAFVAVYLLKDYDRIVVIIHDLLPARRRPQVTRIMRKIDHQLHAYLRGQITVCVCLGLMYCAGLKCLGILFAIPLGIFGGLVSFVPYMGLVLTLGPATLLALLQYGLDWHLLGVFATFVIAQTMEGYVLTPRIVGAQVGLSPVWVILSIMVFSTLFGFVGLLIAVPLAAVLKVLVAETLDYYRRSPLFTEDAPLS